jgi:hypothetical protein
MHRQTVIVKAPRSFIEQVLWPEFRELSAALSAYLTEITEKLIREEVHVKLPMPKSGRNRGGLLDEMVHPGANAGLLIAPQPSSHSLRTFRRLRMEP